MLGFLLYILPSIYSYLRTFIKVFKIFLIKCSWHFYLSKVGGGGGGGGNKKFSTDWCNKCTQ